MSRIRDANPASFPYRPLSSGVQVGAGVAALGEDSLTAESPRSISTR
ncbi:MAG: hypothetical protein QM658_06025 [Gordonia sp. (in: high G+C Gram-positive bacteria)]